LVEKFRIGPILDRTDDLDDPYFNCKEGRVYYFPNTWPDIDRFNVVMKRYYEAMTELSKSLLWIIEIGLELHHRLLTSSIENHTSILSMNYYRSLSCDIPLWTEDELLKRKFETHVGSDKLSLHSTCLTNSEENEKEEQLDHVKVIRVAAHKDVSMLTIVSQRSTFLSEAEYQHLELWKPNTDIISREGMETGRWIPMDVPKNVLVVHIGDCLADWSKNKLQSTLHRVVAAVRPSNRDQSEPCDRFSLAFFLSPNYQTNVDNSTFRSEHTKKSSVESPYTSYSHWRKDHIKRALKIQQQNRAARLFGRS